MKRRQMRMNNKDINIELSQNFLDFSHEANVNRAFADARDGLKPGQRASLWEMFSKGYSSAKPHVKAAKISGGVIATWWPHGSTAVYETFARMSQGWINNIPEVDWHGANGSIQISGAPAADRYCEARLSKSTEEGLLTNIKKQNVPMKLNFSEDEQWPEVFPALYPRLLVNGCQGIGSTIANTWLPHSLDELAVVIEKYLSTGDIDYANLAPSFPTGGIIINKDELRPIYETGKGKVVLRGKVEIDGDKILITEVPYQVYVEPFIEQVRDLVNKDEIVGITNILNKSDKKHLLIEIECDGNVAKILKQLYAKTDLQKSYSANQFALVGKTPKLLTFKEYIDVYLQHNYECIKREFSFDLEKSKRRLEIVDGLIKALEDIDNIITLIKNSESTSNAIANLIDKYKISEVQAKAIVDMKLGKLAKLEKVELNEEKQQLTSTIQQCEEVIGSASKQQEIYLDRFLTFVKKYPCPRKTELSQTNEPKEEKESTEVEPEKCVVVMTEGGSLKRVPQSSFRTQRRNSKGIKTQEDITSCVIRTNTVDQLMIFTNKGNLYRLLVDNIPSGTNAAKGTPIAALIEMETDEKPVIIYSIYKDTDAQYVVFVTKNGLIKKTSLEEYTKTKKKTGLLAIKLREGDELASVFLVKDEDIIIASKGGYGIKFGSKEISTTARSTSGVKGINLGEGDTVCAALPIRDTQDELAVFTTNGLGKKCKLSELPLQKRGGKGVVISKKEEVSAIALVSDSDSVLIIGDKSSVCLSATDIPSFGRTTAGNIMIKDNHIKSVSKI